MDGIVECFWVSGLKHADSLPLYALTALGIAFSFSAMIVACKVLEVSIAYSVFVGIGTAGVVAGEILIFGEAFSALKVALIAVLFVMSLSLLSLSMRGISMGVAYAIWTGISAGGGVIVGILLFKESKSLSKLALIDVIIACSAGLKYL